MKHLLLACTILTAGMVYASNFEGKKQASYADDRRYIITDTVPRDTADTTHKPDSIFLTQFLKKN
jgi:hypothetical protein